MSEGILLQHPPQVVVLVHGSGSGPWVFNEWAPSLPQSRVVTPDLMDALEPETASMDDYAERVVAAARDAAHPLLLVGWSMGGLVAMMAAGRFALTRSFCWSPVLRGRCRASMQTLKSRRGPLTRRTPTALSLPAFGSGLSRVSLGPSGSAGSLFRPSNARRSSSPAASSGTNAAVPSLPTTGGRFSSSRA
jgi:pimeloyl-ACP methyl ester carboxylesterase